MLDTFFRVRHALDEYESLTASEQDIQRLVSIDAFKGQPLRPVWIPFPVWSQQSYEDGASRLPGDFANFVSGALAMTIRAAESLRPLMEGRGEFLPLGGTPPWVVWNCTRVVDALDFAKTEGHAYPSGKHFMQVSRYVLRAAAVHSETIFKVPERVTSDLFVSERWRAAVLESNLHGLDFEQVATS